MKYRLNFASISPFVCTKFESQHLVAKRNKENLLPVLKCRSKRTMHQNTSTNGRDKTIGYKSCSQVKGGVAFRKITKIKAKKEQYFSCYYTFGRKCLSERKKFKMGSIVWKAKVDGIDSTVVLHLFLKFLPELFHSLFKSSN